MKLLFICSANIARSRTGENLLAGSCEYEVKSAGFFMENGSGQLVTQELVDWADLIILMDEVCDRHLTRLILGFKLDNKPVAVLGIPNRYQPGDPVLVALLKEKLAMIGISVKPTLL